MLILDVGCGTNPTGHVNIDTLQRWDEEKRGHVKHLIRFIIADGMNLPFRGKVFDQVNCVMALEHFINPAKAIRDFVYVANSSYFVVPNNPIIKGSALHLFSWSQDSFHNLLGIFYEDIVITTGTQDIKSFDRIYLKIIMKIPLFRLPIIRFASRILKLKIYAMCCKPRLHAREDKKCLSPKNRNNA